MKDEEVRKYAPYVLAGVAVGILLYALVARPDTAHSPAPDAPAPEKPAPEAQAPAPDVIVGGETEVPTKPGDYPKQALPYVESGYRFQFSGCHGSPGQLTVKKGKYFLLDNRDDKAVTIAVAGQSYKIGAYGAVVAAVSKVGTHNITCNGGGAASLNVEP